MKKKKYVVNVYRVQPFFHPSRMTPTYIAKASFLGKELIHVRTISNLSKIILDNAPIFSKLSIKNDVPDSKVEDVLVGMRIYDSLDWEEMKELMKLLPSAERHYSGITL